MFRMKPWNKKGMTLIEVIVILLLSSILMVIAGSLLLNSMGYFNKTAQSNYEKMAADAISSYVREQLVYANEVQISTVKPDKSDDWHWISIDEHNHLTRDDKPVYNDDFYRSRVLRIKAKCYDNYRLDLSFSLHDDEGKQYYKTSTTLELVNIKAKTEKGETIINKGLQGTSTDISDFVNKKSGYKIFYKVNGALGIKDDPDNNYPDIDYDDPAYEGTVYDELRCRDKQVTLPGEAGNNKGEWIANADYMDGDYVTYAGVTYRAIKDIGNGKNPAQNNGNGWKPIDPPYWISGASYKENDVVIYRSNSKYYQALKNGLNNSQTTPDQDDKWKELSKSELNEIIEEHKSENFCKINNNEDETCDANRPYKTVGDELCERSSTITAPDIGHSGNREDGWTNNKGGFEENLQNFSPNHEQRFYRKGDFVTLNGETWRLIGLYTDISQMPPGGWWKLIQEEWDSRSYYEENDIVKYNEAYYTCISKSGAIPGWDPNVPGIWKKVEKNPNGSGWIDA